MTEEPKKGQWSECEIAGIKHLVWVPPAGSFEEGQPFPFLAYPADEAEAVKKKWSLGPTEDEIWRKDYEAARAFANKVHMLLEMCETYAKMLALCRVWPMGSETPAIEALRDLRDNIERLTDAKIHKQPHRDTIFISPIPPEKE